MIILQIITTLVYGGAERLLVNFSNALADRHDIHIIYLKGEPKLINFLDRRIQVHRVPLGILTGVRIRKLIRTIKPDVVHTHLGHADLLGQWAARSLGIKTFCTMHNVHFKWSWVDRIFFFLYWVTFKFHGRHCKVSCISKAVAVHVHNRLGVNHSNISVNYNAIPDVADTISKDQARMRLSLASEDFVILTIGRLRIQKSIDTLLEATSILKEQIRNLRVVIVGEGEMESSLREKAKLLQIELLVEFRGGTSTPEQYYAASDVFILPSVFEGLPTVILEAFRAVMPVIGSNIDGIRELVCDGQNGLLFPPRDPQALADRISTLYTSPEFRVRLAEAGNAAYKGRFEITKYALQMEAMYAK